MTPLQALSTFDRIVICGPADTGKSKLSEQFRGPVVHTDDYIETVPFEEVPHVVFSRVAGLRRYCIEGVQGGRVLRKAAQLGTLGRDFDPQGAIWLDQPFVLWDGYKRAQAKGLQKIWDEFLPMNNGVKVVVG
jgi:hypothetical protein